MHLAAFYFSPETQYSTCFSCVHAPCSLTYTLGPDFWSRVKTRIATCSMSGTWSGDDYNTYFTKCACSAMYFLAADAMLCALLQLDS